MRFRSSSWLLALVAAGLVMAADGTGDAKVLMETARRKEVVDGDLNGAIKQYAQVVAKHKNDRAVVASALVRMAECYEKMGNAEARKIYEQVVKDYADQTEATRLARMRLGVSGAPPAGGIVTRQVWTRSAGSVSADGRYLSFADSDGNLALHDLKTGQDRALTHTGNWGGEPEYAGASLFSPDGKQVAYYWEHDLKDRDPKIELRVVSVAENAVPRVLFFSEEAWSLPSAWSANGKWIAATLTRKDNSRQIGLISTTDGSLRGLKTIGWRGPRRIAFSPDGQYLGYDLPAGQDSDQRDVYVLSIDGSQETPAVVHSANDMVVGWTPDQKHLLFQSDRSGRMGLWAVPFENGKVRGQAISISSDFGNPIASTDSGALYYSKRAGQSDIYLVSVDFMTGKVIQPPSRPIEQSVGFNLYCSLSADGNQLAYVFVGADGEQKLAIRSMTTGQIRVLPQRWTRIMPTAAPRWAPDGSSLIAGATDAKGRSGVFSIDAQSGDLTPITTDGKLRLWLISAPDGKSFFFWNPTTMSTWQRAFDSGQEHEVFKGVCRAVSPDGRHLACAQRDTNEHVIQVVPVAGGEARELARFSAKDVGLTPVWAWTQDGQAVIYGTRGIGGAKGGVWVAPLNGGHPYQLDQNVTFSGDVALHPDGKHLFYAGPAVTSSAEGGIFMLENYLSSLTGRH